MSAGESPELVSAWDSALAFLSPPASPHRDRNVRSAYREVLARLGNPHEQLRCIHVAGTNGKGSTAFAIANILRCAGYSTGTYCSPFVFDISERWMLDTRPVTRHLLVKSIQRVRPVVESLEQDGAGTVTEFERKTLVAFDLFRARKVDYAVIEVGIGGRLDATNVIPPPLAAAITTIGLDHQALLGDTRALIAGEKAGILKPGTGFVATPVDDAHAGPVIAAAAEAAGVSRYVVDPSSPDWDYWLPAGLPAHQRSNRAVAARVAIGLRDMGSAHLTDLQIQEGLRTPGLPGRFDVRFVGDKILLLDVAHNPDGARELGASIRARFAGSPLVLVVGASRNHDPRDFLGSLDMVPDVVIATEPLFRPFPAGDTLASASALGWDCRAVVPVADAVRQGLAATPPGGVCCVTGSFFVVGEVPRELLLPELQ